MTRKWAYDGPSRERRCWRRDRELGALADLDLDQRAKVKCPSCSAVVEGGKFCPECGEKLAKVSFCTECGAEQKDGAKFCSECGHKM